MLSSCETAHRIPIGREQLTKNHKTRTDKTNAERQRRYKERRRAQNPVKPVDQTNAERQRRYRERKRLIRLGLLPFESPAAYVTAGEPSMSEEDEVVSNLAPLPLELCWDSSLEIDHSDSSPLTSSSTTTSIEHYSPEIKPIDMILNLSCNSAFPNVPTNKYSSTMVHKNKTKTDRTNRERQRRYRERKRQLMLELKSATPKALRAKESILGQDDDTSEIVLPLPLELCWAELSPVATSTQ